MKLLPTVSIETCNYIASVCGQRKAEFLDQHLDFLRHKQNGDLVLAREIHNLAMVDDNILLNVLYGGLIVHRTLRDACIINHQSLPITSHQAVELFHHNKGQRNFSAYCQELFDRLGDHNPHLHQMIIQLGFTHQKGAPQYKPAPTRSAESGILVCALLDCQIKIDRGLA